MTVTAAPATFAEDRRQRILDETGILDTPASYEFDRLTRIAAKHFACKIAIVSFIDRDRNWFKSCVGFEAKQTSRDIAFCAHAVTQDEVFLVLDAADDARFYRNPLVTGAPFIRFYAGAPIVLRGANIGSFCVIDDRPRAKFTREEERFLKALSSIISNCMEAQRFNHASDLELEEHIAKTCQQLDQADRERSRFLALISHELRTPMNAVIGFADVLSEAEKNGLSELDRVNYLNEIKTGGRRLLQTVEDALRFAAADSGQLPLHEEEFSTREVARQSIMAASIEAKPKAVKIRKRAEECPNLNADFSHTEQILFELLSNAVKFSPKGGDVTLHICAKSGRIHFIVEDEGCGFADTNLGRMTTPFMNGDDLLSRHGEGVGLGLPTADRLARLQGATISLENRETGGARAQLIFPVHRSSSTVKQTNAPAEAARRRA